MISTNQKMVPISVNMSRNHSKPERFMHEFLSIFNEFNIPPNMVEVEILERSFMNENTLKTFTDLLHQEGFSVAMDDFGSGESSLNMLTQIPVDVLKFDRTSLKPLRLIEHFTSITQTTSLVFTISISPKDFTTLFL